MDAKVDDLICKAVESCKILGLNLENCVISDKIQNELESLKMNLQKLVLVDLKLDIKPIMR